MCGELRNGWRAFKRAYSSSSDATYFSMFSSDSPMNSEKDSSSIVGTAPLGFTARNTTADQGISNSGIPKHLNYTMKHEMAFTRADAEVTKIINGPVW